MSAEPRKPGPVPKRFIVAPATLRFDRFMNSAIMFGGIGIIVAVFGIFAFILLEIAPLFQRPTIESASPTALQAPAGAKVGLDEWGRLPFFLSDESAVSYQSTRGGPPERLVPDLGTHGKVSLRRWDGQSSRLLLGTEEGEVGFLEAGYLSEHEDDGSRVVLPKVTPSAWMAMGNGTITDAHYADGGKRKLFAALLESEGKRRLVTLSQSQSQTLMGAGEVVSGAAEELSALTRKAGRLQQVLVAPTADSLLLTDESNAVHYLFRNAGGWSLRQTFRPFEDGQPIAGMNFLFGGVSVVIYDESGLIRIFSLSIPEGETTRVFQLTKEMRPLEGPIRDYCAGQRGKSFVVSNANECALCYATTERLRRHFELSFEATSVAIDARGERLGFLDTDGQLNVFRVDDPHPEAGWRSLFGKVWYEGHSKPQYMWQSTGGTDAFEPKFSLIPLIIGSLKGTFYAMFFAVPIALLAAIYTSQFLKPEVKRIVKPSMEIMASLPSVVLGFLGALWLAPLIDDRVPSLMLAILAMPLAAGLMGWVWGQLPIALRNRLPKGSEYVIVMPIIAVLTLAGWNLGPVLERLLFVVTLPDGSQVADFRLWWPEFTGLPYDQRNCLVVGFMMGFAVIPVIFTIAEDALSNVPPSLTSASEALGASRWQVVRTIVLPVASAGMFSALMIGFGRAVGETMIVVMATGNTPLMDETGRMLFGELGVGGGKFPLADHWNLFDGMRTLSANIAVELPEAAQGSTHYRTLFLGALVLFVMTFALNTVAELLRQKLRERFQLT
jgi:phosphate transport system permease protein